MRPYASILLASLLLPAISHAQNWTPLPLASTDDILAMEQGSFSDIWLVGRNGLVAVSDLSHESWTIRDVGTTEDLHSVIRQSQSQVWVSGAAGTARVILFNSWQSANVGIDERFVLFSRGSGVAHAVGDSGSIFLSLDFGLTWSPQISNTTASLNHGTGSNTSTAWVVGDGGTILTTTDGGTQWLPQNSGTTANLNYIIEAGPWLVVAGDNGTILRSNDGGTTWTPVITHVTANLNALAPSAFDAAVFLACGDNGTLLRTTDFGATWCSIDTETTLNLHAARYVGLQEIIIGGDNGLLQQSTNNGGNCGIPTAAGPASTETFSMRGPYPQPARGGSVLALTSDRSRSLEVTAHDLRGRRVATLFDGRIEAGQRLELTVDTHHWPAGVYFVRATGPGLQRIRKLVVLE